MQPEVFSSGYLVFRLGRPIQFLLLRHPQRWDLPKGHLDPGETVEQAAIRELCEETGLRRDDFWTDPSFTFVQQYVVKDAKRPKLKELTIYLAWLRNDRPLSLTEHEGYRWFDWSPPHTIQRETIDPLLAAVDEHFRNQTIWPPDAVR